MNHSNVLESVAQRCYLNPEASIVEAANAVIKY